MQGFDKRDQIKNQLAAAIRKSQESGEPPSPELIAALVTDVVVAVDAFGAAMQAIAIQMGLIANAMQKIAEAHIVNQLDVGQ
jgi:hypothetical protein